MLLSCTPSAQLPASTPAPSNEGGAAEPAGEPSIVALRPIDAAWSSVLIGTEDGTHYIVDEPLRATVTGDRAEVAEDAFAANIVAVARVASGFLFVAADGAVARSATYLGPLERFGPAVAGPLAARRASLSVGRLAVVARGALWTSDGSAPPARVSTLPAGVVTDAVFTSATHGVASFMDGTVVRTADAGATWTPVELRTSVREVERHGDQIYLSQGDEVHRLREDGTFVTDQAKVETWSQTRRRLGVIAPLAEALRRRAPALVDPQLVRTDGLTLETLSNKGATDLVARNVATGEEAFTLHRAFTPQSCKARAAGNYSIFSCIENNQYFAFIVGPDRKVRSFGVDHSLMGVASDQSFAAFPGVCRDGGTQRKAPLPEGHRCTCLVPLASQAQPREICGPQSVIAALRGGLLGWPMPYDRAPRALSFTPFDGGPARQIPVDLAPGVDAPYEPFDQTHDELSWRVVQIREPGESRTSKAFALLLGTVEEGLETRPLPEGARTAGFIDARRGLAAGEDGAHLWFTRDAGRTWAKLPLPIDGAAASLRWAPKGSCGGSECSTKVTCSASECVVGQRVRVRWDRSASAGKPLLAAESAEAPPARRPLDLGRYTCRADAPVAMNAKRPPLMAGRDVMLVREATPGGLVELTSRPRGPKRDEVQLAWSGSDARGTFQVATRVATVPELVPPPVMRANKAAEGSSDYPELAPILVTRSLILVQRCALNSERPAGAKVVCQALRGEPGGPLVALPALDASNTDSLVGGSWMGIGRTVLEAPFAVASTAGDVVLLHPHGTPGMFFSRVSAKGAVTRSHAVLAGPWAGADAPEWMPMRRGGEWGFSATPPMDPTAHWFFPVDGPRKMPAAVGALPSGALLPCRGPTPPDAAMLWSFGLPRTEGVPFMWAAGRTEIELSQGRACVRAVQGRSYSGAAFLDHEQRARLEATADGMLAGISTIGTQHQTVRCQPVVAATNDEP